MKIIDARSGEEMAVGKTVKYPDGESHTLLQVEPGILRARARVRRTYQSYATGRPVTDEQWVPLAVRWMHPGFFLQHVAFFPS